MQRWMVQTIVTVRGHPGEEGDARGTMFPMQDADREAEELLQGLVAGRGVIQRCR